jgi:hypothetical protein
VISIEVDEIVRVYVNQAALVMFIQDIMLVFPIESTNVRTPDEGVDAAPRTVGKSCAAPQLIGVGCG